MAFFLTYLEFDRLLRKHASETGLPVIVDYYSDSCGPCRMMAPIFKTVAKEYMDRAVFVKVDTNRQPELSSRYQIRSLPTFQYFVGGRKTNQALGGIGEAALRQQVDQAVRQAELENTMLTLDTLTAYYQQQDPSKVVEEIQNVHQKCVGMTKHSDECVGAAANQLARRLKKKYGKLPTVSPRFDPAKAKTSGSTNKESSSSNNNNNTKKRNNAKESASAVGPQLHLASLEELQDELERRLDEIRERQVESEDADEDEPDPDFHRWRGPGEFPERLVIVGAGPAGLAAALYGARAGLEPLVIAPSMGGQLQGKGVEVENYPGLGGNITGPSVIASMRAQAAHFGAVFEDDVVFAVTAVERVNPNAPPEPIRLHTNATGTIETHTLIVATGAEANWLGVPGEWELRGGGVSSCAVCDGFLYHDRDIVIVGGGDAAMEDALVLARTSRHVTVIHRRDQFRASKVLADRVLQHPLIDVRWNATVDRILGKQVETSSSQSQHEQEETVDMDALEKVVVGVMVRDTVTGNTEQIACDAVFVAIGHTPATAFLKGVVNFDPHHPGYVHVQQGSTATSAPGIFAAGDVSDAVYRQAITSAGSGAAAALDAERYLSEHGLGNEAAELEAELLADLMSEQQHQGGSAYNVYDDAGGKNGRHEGEHGCSRRTIA